MRSISVSQFQKLATALAVAAVCSMPASAQASKGEFTLRHDVHWGSLVVPAGSYSYSVEHHATEVLLLRPKMGGTGHFILASSISQPTTPGANQLTLEQHGADWYVTSMAVKEMDEVLLFQAPRTETAFDVKPKLATIASK